MNAGNICRVTDTSSYQPSTEYPGIYEHENMTIENDIGTSRCSQKSVTFHGSSGGIITALE